ncbi:MAG TPA: (Fe-S)-binding protein [bacterium]|nr:(Fe-S)-binding protein [bacterium]HPS30646.1 (Fe-S)-binding protein [bacterium]
MSDVANVRKKLPGYDCGLCGSKTCDQFAIIVDKDPLILKRCIHITSNVEEGNSPSHICIGCGKSHENDRISYIDSLGRDFDFVLDSFPGEPGPKEIIIPHNPQRTSELDIKVGDIVIGRPLGMSCGCPVTHCGIITDVDKINGVMSWCVTGPLEPRLKGCKDIGYYSAEAYEGLVLATNKEIKIGMRYWFMPHKCMLQWRHSGLVNFINKGPAGLHIRLEGLFIG